MPDETAFCVASLTVHTGDCESQRDPGVLHFCSVSTNHTHSFWFYTVPAIGGIIAEMTFSLIKVFVGGLCLSCLT